MSGFRAGTISSHLLLNDIGIYTHDQIDTNLDNLSKVNLINSSSIVGYSTITEALSNASSGDVVCVPPGTWNESITIPAGVKLRGRAGKEVTTIAGDGVGTNDVITLSTGCSFEGFQVNIPTGAAYAINAGTSFSAACREFTLRGQGGTGKGVLKSNAGALALSAFVVTGNCSACIEISNGIVSGHNFNFLSGTITDGLLISGGRFTGSAFGITSPNMTYGVHASGGNIDINGLIARDVNTCIYVDSDNAIVEIVAARMDTSITTHLLVDAGINDASVEISNGVMSYNKISYPLTNSNIHLSYLDPRDTDEALQVEAELAVGRVGLGRELIAGEGDSTTYGMICLTNTNGEAGVWVDETEAAASPTGSTLTWPGVGANNAVYIGGDHAFPGVKINITVATILGGGSISFQYWNGSTWATLPTMAAMSSYPYTQYGATSTLQTGSQQERFGNTPSWSKKTLNGENKYWARGIITSPITTAATIEQFKLHTNRFEANSDGMTEWFGQARPERLLPVHKQLTVAESGSTPGAQSVPISTNITLVGIANKFANNSVDARGMIVEVPIGLDTSKPIKISITWFTPSTTGNCEWELVYHKIEPGHVFDGTASDSTISQVTAAPAVANAAAVTDFEIDVTDYLIEDSIAIKIQRDATGGNPDDTIANYVVLVGLAASATFWRS